MPKTAMHPIPRLEGHEKIELLLDGDGKVKEAYWQPEQGEFERFFLGRPAEEMPRLVPNICGMNLFAHHLAATKALDDLYGVEPPPAARLIRELAFNAAQIEDCIRSVFLTLPASAAGAEPGIAAFAAWAGSDAGLMAVQARQKNRKIIGHLFGKASHPEGGLPGGVPRGLTEQDRGWIRDAAVFSVEFVKAEIERFKQTILDDKLLTGTSPLRACTMALVDERNRMSLYEGRIRIIDSEGGEYARFSPGEYEKYISEWADPRTGTRFAFLKPLGWQGLAEGGSTSVFLIDPLARLGVADGMQTPLAQKEADLLFERLGERPAHHASAVHWARLICALQAAERNVEITGEPQLVSRDIRNMNLKLKAGGIGAVEAPHGILIHHYEADGDGIIVKADIIAPARNSAAPVSLSLKKAAEEFVKGEEVGEGFLDRIESAFRAYAPSLSCAAFTPGKMPLHVKIRNSQGDIIREIRRD